MKEGNKIRECQVNIERITTAEVTTTTSTSTITMATNTTKVVAATMPIMKTAAPIVSRMLRNTSNNENIGTVQSEDKAPDDNELLNYEAETEVDRPNNCYTVEEFCENNPTLQNIIEKAIIEHRNDNKPFQIDHPFSGRQGQWIIHSYKDKMMVVRLEDNYRLLDRLQIPVVLHSMQDKNTANESDKDCDLQINASQEMTEDNEESEKPKDENGEDMETSDNTTIEITPPTKTDTKKN